MYLTKPIHKALARSASLRNTLLVACSSGNTSLTGKACVPFIDAALPPKPPAEKFACRRLVLPRASELAPHPHPILLQQAELLAEFGWSSWTDSAAARSGSQKANSKFCVHLLWQTVIWLRPQWRVRCSWSDMWLTDLLSKLSLGPFLQEDAVTNYDIWKLSNSVLHAACASQPVICERLSIEASADWSWIPLWQTPLILRAEAAESGACSPVAKEKILDWEILCCNEHYAF